MFINRFGPLSYTFQSCDSCEHRMVPSTQSPGVFQHEIYLFGFYIWSRREKVGQDVSQNIKYRFEGHSEKIRESQLWQPPCGAD